MDKMKEIEDYLFWYRREIDQKLSPTLAGRIYLDHIEYLLSKIEELEKRLHKAAGDISFWREQQNDSCKRVKELEGAEEERHRLSKLLIEARTRIVELLNAHYSKDPNNPDYFKLVEDDYKLCEFQP